MSFDGKDDWVNIGEINDKNAITLETTIEYFGSGEIMANFETGGMGLYDSNGHPVMQVYIEGKEYQNVVSPNVLSIGTIYTITGTYDGHFLNIYVDGELKASSQVEGKIKNPDLNTVMAIGVNPGGSNTQRGIL